MTSTRLLAAACLALLTACGTPSGAAPHPAPGAPTRTEGDTNLPPYDRRAFTEQTVRLTWQGTTDAGRNRMCTHPRSFISPALDQQYAARLITARCQDALRQAARSTRPPARRPGRVAGF